MKIMKKTSNKRENLKKELASLLNSRILFKQNDEEIDDDFLDEEVLEEDKDDEAEDYKTYLERQKT